jgi:PQ loop repeat
VRDHRHGIARRHHGIADCAVHHHGEAGMLAEIAGFTGAGISGGAYIPQIGHLVRARCSAGISELAFGAWLVSTVLILVQAVAIHALVFIALGTMQLIATFLIMFFGYRYKDTVCDVHTLVKRETA